jgi:hypothetical protein
VSGFRNPAGCGEVWTSSSMSCAVGS